MKKGVIGGSNKSLNKYPSHRRNSEDNAYDDDDDYEDDDDSYYSDDFSDDEAAAATKKLTDRSEKVTENNMNRNNNNNNVQGKGGGGGGAGRRSRVPPPNTSGGFSNAPSTRPTHPMQRLKAAQAAQQKRGGGGVIDSTERAAIQRLLSARRLKMNDLKNENEELILQLRALREENRLLKRTQIKQEKALEKFEDEESELPRLVQRHNKDLAAVKEQLKKAKETGERDAKRVVHLEGELAEKKEALKKLSSLAADKQLGDRETLRKRLEEAEKQLGETSEKANSLQRYSDNLQKNLNRQINSEKAKHIETAKSLARVTRELDELKLMVRRVENNSNNNNNNNNSNNKG